MRSNEKHHLLAIVMADEKLNKAWKDAESALNKGKYHDALEILREIDASAENATTLRLAGSAVLMEARESTLSRPKKLYRKAADLLEDAVKLAPRDKKANANLNHCLNEMQDLGISRSSLPRLINNGTPTLAGLVAILMIPVLFVGIIVIATGGNSLPTEVVLHVTWTDDNNTLQEGEIVLELYPDKAPSHVENFQELVKQGKYDDVIFHRVINGFMIQGGDFTAQSGSGGHAVIWDGYCDGQPASSKNSCPQSEWTLEDEADNGLIHEAYSISMAKTSAANTGGSQFFIVSGSGTLPSHLDGVHTVFGKVISGKSYVDSIEKVSTAGSDKPENDVTLVKAEFLGESEPEWWQFWH